VNFSDSDALLTAREELLYDLSVLKGISKDNQQTIQKMLAVFVEKATEEMGQIQIASNEQNWQHLAAVAHKMKPALAYLGMKTLENKINEIQINARNKNEIEKMPFMIQGAEQLLKKIIVQLKKEMV
jgi:HPt (histidine-containing phosphotransfer) domain-containing protein